MEYKYDDVRTVYESFMHGLKVDGEILLIFPLVTFLRNRYIDLNSHCGKHWCCVSNGPVYKRLSKESFVSLNSRYHGQLKGVPIAADNVISVNGKIMAQYAHSMYVFIHVNQDI